MHHGCSGVTVARLILPLPAGPVLESVEHRSIGTNGYVSTWGAITSICPPAAV